MLHGTAIDGGLTTHEYTATAGTTWSSGGLIATYKGGSVDPIHASQRSYTDHLPEPATLYPGSDLHSGLVSAHQRSEERRVGKSVSVRVDLGGRRIITTKPKSKIHSEEPPIV